MVLCRVSRRRSLRGPTGLTGSGREVSQAANRRRRDCDEEAGVKGSWGMGEPFLLVARHGQARVRQSRPWRCEQYYEFGLRYGSRQGTWAVQVGSRGPVPRQPCSISWRGSVRSNGSMPADLSRARPRQVPRRWDRRYRSAQRPAAPLKSRYCR